MRLKRENMFGSDEGTSVLEVAIILPFLLLILMGAVDFGRGYYLAIEVMGAAHAGATYGAQDPTDTTGMQNVATLDAPDVSNMTATGSYGCECSDGTQKSASCAASPSGCSANVVYYATVTTSVTYTPLFPWKGINSSITITRSSTMRSANE